MRSAKPFLLALFLTLPAFAQVQQSGVDGTVTDATGVALRGVTIELRDPGTNSARMAITNDAGHYRLQNVPPGNYTLGAQLSGLAPAQTVIHLTIGQTAHADLRLQLQAAHETLEVSAAPSGIDATAPAPPTVVDTARIEELPARSRNYLDFVLLAPGVTTARGGAGPGISHTAPDSGFSFAGQRPRSNVLTIDGLNNNDEYSGTARTELSLETVKEFDVVSHGSSAETGGGAGGSINVVTKSGANSMHGDAFVFRQDSRLNARSFDQGGRKPPLRRYRTGGALGGPVLRDRTFYYAAGEYESSDSTLSAAIDPAARDAINRSLLRLRGNGAGLLTSGAVPTARRETEVSGKVNHQLTPAASLVTRIVANDNREKGSSSISGALIDPGALGNSRVRDMAVTVSEMALLGTEATNEVRTQWARRSTSVRSASDEPGVLVAGVAEFGSAYGGNASHHQTYEELGDTVAVGRGQHLFRIGGDLTHVHVTGGSDGGDRGLYVFRSLDAFMKDMPDSYRQAFGNQAVAIDATRYNAFLQDDWTHGAVTVSGGLRLDGEHLPERLHITSRQLQPRLGVAWAPRSDWVLRATAGLFADRIPLVAIERPLASAGSAAFEQLFDGAAAASIYAATRGGSLPDPAVNAARARYTARPGSWTPGSRQFSVAGEHAFTPYLSASMTVVRTSGRHLLRTINRTAPGAPGGDVFEVQPSASSSYTGFTVALNRRMFEEVEWSASYTLSKATDDASDFFEQPSRPEDPAAERARSLYDQRHRFTASALIELGDEKEPGSGAGTGRWWTEILRHIELAPILVIASGGHANPLTGIDGRATHAYPLSERPPHSGRNSLQLPTTAVLNLRVVKYIPLRPHGRLDLVVEAFNLLNRRNVEQIGVYRGVDAAPAATFGSPVRTEESRQVQLALDFEF